MSRRLPEPTRCSRVGVFLTDVCTHHDRARFQLCMGRRGARSNCILKMGVFYADTGIRRKGKLKKTTVSITPWSLETCGKPGHQLRNCFRQSIRLCVCLSVVSVSVCVCVCLCFQAPPYCNLGSNIWQRDTQGNSDWSRGASSASWLSIWLTGNASIAVRKNVASCGLQSVVCDECGKPAM